VGKESSLGDDHRRAISRIDGRPTWSQRTRGKREAAWITIDGFETKVSIGFVACYAKDPPHQHSLYAPKHLDGGGHSDGMVRDNKR